MVEVQIPKDIRRYKTKVVGPFTMRTLICFIIACICAYGGWLIAKNLLGVESISDAVPVCMTLMAPAIIFGWISPYGMTMEVFLASTVISMFLAPKHRKYKIDNTYEGILKDIDKEEQDLLKQRAKLLKEKKKKKKNVSTLQKPKKKPNKNPHYIGYC